jgi:hypothetical protein
MRDRPYIQQHHHFAEKISPMRIHHTFNAQRALANTSDDSWKDDRCGIASSLNPIHHSTTRKSVLSQVGEVVRTKMSVRRPAGMPLSKPPMLFRMTKSGSCRSNKRSDATDRTEDEESSLDDSVLCDSKIYEFSDVANDMNPDERLFLEAACALSASAAPPRQQETLAAIETTGKKRSRESKSKLSDQVSLEKRRPLKQKCPMGPPPYVLPSIKKGMGFQESDSVVVLL